MFLDLYQFAPLQQNDVVTLCLWEHLLSSVAKINMEYKHLSCPSKKTVYPPTSKCYNEGMWGVQCAVGFILPLESNNHLHAPPVQFIKPISQVATKDPHGL